MSEIVIASRNPGKLREIRQILGDLPCHFSGLDQYPQLPAIEEDGKSFHENVLKKARCVAHTLEKIAIADDSGLEVEVLDGRPGIYSARFSGPDATDEQNNAYLLKQLASIPMERRAARFVCVIACVTPAGRELVVEACCEGQILLNPRGCGGFGYDPLFYLPSLKKTFAELSVEEKSRVSHRGKCLKALKEKISDFLTP